MGIQHGVNGQVVVPYGFGNFFLFFQYFGHLGQRFAQQITYLQDHAMGIPHNHDIADRTGVGYGAPEVFQGYSGVVCPVNDKTAVDKINETAVRAAGILIQQSQAHLAKALTSPVIAQHAPGGDGVTQVTHGTHFCVAVPGRMVARFDDDVAEQIRVGSQGDCAQTGKQLRNLALGGVVGLGQSQEVLNFLVAHMPAGKEQFPGIVQHRRIPGDLYAQFCQGIDAGLNGFIILAGAGI